MVRIVSIKCSRNFHRQKSFNLLAVYPNHGEFGLKRQGKTLNPEGRNAFSWVRFEFRYKERMPDIFTEKGTFVSIWRGANWVFSVLFQIQGWKRFERYAAAKIFGMKRVFPEFPIRQDVMSAFLALETFSVHLFSATYFVLANAGILYACLKSCQVY